MNFLDKSPTLDYYWSIALIVPHSFTWAAAIACTTKIININFYKATMVLYAFCFFLDAAATLWRIISTSICDSATCIDNRGWGIVGYIGCGLFLIWDVIVFITLALISQHIYKTLLKQNLLHKQIIAAGVASENPECDKKIYEEYLKLAETPPANFNFHRRFALVAASIVEPLFFFATLIVMMTGLVIHEAFMWSIFVQSLHAFTWVFLMACIYNQYSKLWFHITGLLYIMNLITDMVALVWRGVAIAICDVDNNVDCVFRSFPCLLPIELLTAFLVITDLVVLFTLSYFFVWLNETIWLKALKLEKCIVELRNTAKKEARDTEKARPLPPPLPEEMLTTVKRRHAIKIY
jgi:hypothetical protein